VVSKEDTTAKIDCAEKKSTREEDHSNYSVRQPFLPRQSNSDFRSECFKHSTKKLGSFPLPHRSSPLAIFALTVSEDIIQQKRRLKEAQGRNRCESDSSSHFQQNNFLLAICFRASSLIPQLARRNKLSQIRKPDSRHCGAIRPTKSLKQSKPRTSSKKLDHYVED